MFVTLKNFVDLESSPANHIFPSFLYTNSSSATQATTSLYTNKTHLMHAECKGIYSQLFPMLSLKKIVTVITENQNVLVKNTFPPSYTEYKHY